MLPLKYFSASDPHLEKRRLLSRDCDESIFHIPYENFVKDLDKSGETVFGLRDISIIEVLCKIRRVM